ncbi:hypothetical protein GEV27_07610 [Aeromicrobium sp. S22]|uniref:hypothetical protein n=1 Tax=Aeromicrobium sp. S22 TaxID=2662029 RepID=UPI00129D6B57|nr:hypothetical protein [Aeromicrobium sp. S22]MRK01388.1 hypothetical protein [Aeromicrobium sp. S22]
MTQISADLDATSLARVARAYVRARNERLPDVDYLRARYYGIRRALQMERLLPDELERPLSHDVSYYRAAEDVTRAQRAEWRWLTPIHALLHVPTGCNPLSDEWRDRFFSTLKTFYPTHARALVEAPEEYEVRTELMLTQALVLLEPDLAQRVIPRDEVRVTRVRHLTGADLAEIREVEEDT